MVPGNEIYYNLFNSYLFIRKLVHHQLSLIYNMKYDITHLGKQDMKTWYLASSSADIKKILKFPFSHLLDS